MSINRATLLGRVGGDPETRNFNNGGKVCSFSLATSNKWRDKQSGETREETQWHRISVFDERLIDVCERFVRKGDALYLEGEIVYRKYTDKDGVEKLSTDINLRSFNSRIDLLPNGRREDGASPAPRPERPSGGYAGARPAPGMSDDLDDDIPF